MSSDWEPDIYRVEVRHIAFLIWESLITKNGFTLNPSGETYSTRRRSVRTALRHIEQLRNPSQEPQWQWAAAIHAYK